MSIFDQIGKIVNNSGAQAEPEQDRTAYLDQLEETKADAMDKIYCLFAELGKAYYEDHTDGQQAEYESQMAAIREASAEIARLDQEAEEAAARKRCPSCGAELAEGSRFCNICGIRLMEATDSTGQPEQERNLCPKCGAAIEADDLFCASCGADLRGNGGT